MIYKGTITQGGADTATAGIILTGLNVDSKAGWDITGFKAFWANGYSAVAADALLSVVLATVTPVSLPNSEDEITRIAWGVQNTAGVAVAFNFEPIKKADITESRLTVQSDLYVHVVSAGTGLSNLIYYEISYEIVKLTDMEVMRLLIGGA